MYQLAEDQFKKKTKPGPTLYESEALHFSCPRRSAEVIVRNKW